MSGSDFGSGDVVGWYKMVDPAEWETTTGKLDTYLKKTAEVPAPSPPRPPSWVSALKPEDYTHDVTCMIENSDMAYINWRADGAITLDGEFEANELRELADYMDAVKAWKATR